VPAPDDWTPERLADRGQIAEVLYRYCRAIDRIQADHLIGPVFHVDALIDKTGTPGPVAEWAAVVAARHPGVPAASHMVTNILIDFLGPDSAFVESWCLAVERHPATPSEPREIDRIYRVRYADRFERRADRAWRIASRTFLTDHVMAVPRDPAPDPLGANRLTTRRDADDPAMIMRRELGLPPV
jgi:hypothetical protein